MNVHVNGKRIKIGKSLINHAKEQLKIITNKYLLRPTYANITFTKEKHEFICEASLHLSSGLIAYSSGRADQIYDSYQKSLLRLEKILRRHKRKMRNHHQIDKPLYSVL